MLSAWCLVAAVAMSVMGASAEDSSHRAIAILAAAKAASGGEVWDKITGWHERGTHGSVAYETLLDYRQYGALFRQTRDGKTSVRGYNGAVAWDMGPDGQVTISTDPKLLADARLSAYGSTTAYFFPDRFPARFEYLGQRAEGNAHYDRLRITPEGANSFEIWIDRSTHLVAKLVDRTGPKPVVATMSDYKDINGLKLPSGFSVSDGTAAHTEQAQVQSYELVPVARSDFDPPAPK
jgi:hypothetical protein